MYTHNLTYHSTRTVLVSLNLLSEATSSFVWIQTVWTILDLITNCCWEISPAPSGIFCIYCFGICEAQLKILLLEELFNSASVLLFQQNKKLIIVILPLNKDLDTFSANAAGRNFWMRIHLRYPFPKLETIFYHCYILSNCLLVCLTFGKHVKRCEKSIEWQTRHNQLAKILSSPHTGNFTAYSYFPIKEKKAIVKS